MPDAAQLAQDHWNETPLFLSEQERYSTYPWLYDVAEFREHAGEKVLEIGCGTGADLLQFAKHGAIATGVDLTEKHWNWRANESATWRACKGRTCVTCPLQMKVLITSIRTVF